ncbi:MAG: hypothetical protein V4594_16165 [Bacteroidota bacterium]
MKETNEPNINQSIRLYSALISRVGDTNKDLVKPEWFTEHNGFAYKTLMEELEAYLFEGDCYHPNRYNTAKARVEELLAQVTALESRSKNSKKFEEQSPYLAALAAYMILQLEEALGIMDTIAMEIIQK